MDIDQHTPRWSKTLLALFSITACNVVARYLLNSSRIYLFEQSRCRVYYLAQDPSLVDSARHVEESLCKVDHIQSDVALLNSADFLLGHTPSFLALATFQKLLSIVGLRKLLILNITFTTAQVCLSTFAFYLQQSWDVWAVLAASFIGGLGGSDLVQGAMVSTVMAQVCDQDRLTETYYYLSAMGHVAQVLSATAGSALLRYNVWLLNLCAIAFFIITGCHALIVPPHAGIEIEDLSSSRQAIFGRPEASAYTKSFHATALAMFKRSLSDTFSVLISLFRMTLVPRTIIMLYLFLCLVWRIRAVFMQATSKTVSWDLATVNQWLAFQDFLSWLTLLSIPIIRGTLLSTFYSAQQQDLLVVSSLIALEALACIGMGFSSAPVFLASMSLYSVAQGITESLRGYGTRNLGHGETVEQLYTRLALSASLASLIGASAWSAAYGLVLKLHFLPKGILFWICAVLFGFALLLTRRLRARSYTSLS